MKKIPTLFQRNYENHKVVSISNIVTPGCEWVLKGEGIATEKIDGSCCAIIDGQFYKRYDAKQGKKPPEGAIPCCDPDPVTGHWPHWVLVTDLPEDKWFNEALQNSLKLLNFATDLARGGTFEAVGRHFNGNPYKMWMDLLIPHGCIALNDVPRSFLGIKEYLEEHNIEGIVFWKDGSPGCKIKRTDFGYAWPGKIFVDGKWR